MDALSTPAGAPIHETIQGAALGAKRGVSLGLSDILDRPGEWINDMVSGEEFGTTTEERQTREKGIEAAAPTATLIGDVGASLAIPLPLGKASWLKKAAVGAGIGGTEAAGRTEDLFSEEGLTDVGMGFLMGGALGSSADVVAKTVKGGKSAAKKTSEAAKEFIEQRVVKDVAKINPKIKIDVASLFKEGKAKAANEAVDKVLDKLPSKDFFKTSDIAAAVLGPKFLAGKKAYDAMVDPAIRVNIYKAIGNSTVFAKKVKAGAKKLGITENKATKLIKRNLAKSMGISSANVVAAESAMVDLKDIDASDIAMAALPVGKLKVLAAAKRMDPKKANAAVKILQTDNTKGREAALKTLYKELLQTVKEGGKLRKEQKELLLELVKKFGPKGS